MSGISITLDLDAGDASARLQSLMNRMDRKQPFFESVGQALADSARERFQRETSPDGRAWTPLRPATVRARIRKGATPVSILREKGDLIGSISHRAGEQEVRIGAVAKHAAIHQLGGSISKAAGKRWMAGRRFAKRDRAPDGKEVAIPAHRITIPARPFIGVSDSDQAEIFSMAELWLTR